MKFFALCALMAAGCAVAPEEARDEAPAAAPPAQETGPAPTTPAEASNPPPRVGEAGTPTPPPPRDTLDEAPKLDLTGPMTQGGLLFGKTLPGAKLTLDGEPVMVGPDGRFALGFGRDSALSATLKAVYPGGATETLPITIADREFNIDRVDGVDQSKVDGFTPEQLKKIEADTAKKKAARATTTGEALWAEGFAWPATGRVSGVFGSQRIYNGVPKNMHGGLDIAAPTGTAIKSPAAGIVRLAEPDMYFEGGLVLIDHGHWVESAFMHMSRIDVQAGQRVAKGDVLGAVGATGRATGPHLHWGLKWTNRIVDPQLLVDPAQNPQGAGK
jgi:murein DD-endopeptidase MepM/ murein hydrolase activator NlpD